jgi:hypothetical protein
LFLSSGTNKSISNFRETIPLSKQCQNITVLQNNIQYKVNSFLYQSCLNVNTLEYLSFQKFIPFTMYDNISKYSMQHLHYSCSLGGRICKQLRDFF